jgi:hypothetical protein
MMNTRVYIFHDGDTYPTLEAWSRRLAPTSITRFIGKLSAYLRYRRNPRSQDYMERLVKQTFPDFERHQLLLVEAGAHLPVLDWTALEQIVLLWPDANGTGWARTEREIFRRVQAAASIIVLNGRARCFVLTRSAWRRFRRRRFLEKTFVVEIALLTAFLITSPWLALWDVSQRRR